MVINYTKVNRHSIIYHVGYLLTFLAAQTTCNNFKRSLLIEDDGFELVKILPDGVEEAWDLIPNQELKIPDHVGFCLENIEDDKSIIVEKTGAGKTVSVELSPGESAEIVESETGESGLLQKHTDGSISLHPIGGSVNTKNQINPQNNVNNTKQWKSVADRLEEPISLFSPACDTITIQPPRAIADPPAYDDHITEQIHHTETSEWLLYTLLGGGVVCLWAICFYYALHNTMIGARYLHRDDLWSAWKSEESYDFLLMLKPEQMVDDLIHDITIIYYQEADPITHFLQDIQEEYDTIVAWIQFRNQLARFYIPLGSAFDMLEHRLTLLEHMRKTVHYWRAQQLRIQQ